MPKKSTKEEKETKKQKDQIDLILESSKYKGFHYGTRSGKNIGQQDIISTGSFEFDLVLGGGFRSSCWSRFFGPKECGKTSMALCWGKNWQDFYGDKGFVLYFNAEGRITQDLIDRSCIDTDENRFRVIDCNYYDVIFDIIEELVRNNKKDNYRYFVIIDSTDACERIDDSKKSFADSQKVGGGATVASQAGRRLSLLFNRKGHFLYLCSQLRDNLQTMGPGGGSKPSGGNAPEFYSSLTGQIMKPWTETFIYQNPSDKKSKRIGQLTEIKLIKTPNESSGTVVRIPIKYGLKGGVWRAYEALRIACDWSLYQKSGAWYQIDKEFAEELTQNNIEYEKSIQGEKGLREFFDNNPSLVEFTLNKFKDFYNS